MKLWSSRLSFLILVIFFFARLHISSDARKLPNIMTATEEFQEQFRQLRFEGERMLSERKTGKKNDQIYGVSVREVPDGPNPLHNK
ncbi:hypothetical protein BRARA_I01221 [Brassica rapa]|uniref:Uncharacterized protein n=1 Tax=Brassica campestris TaxID=3711 RepID=M4EFR6_BRACM|nr:CLAVATA3/ESR (CLE)-related protein 14 [Brassica rapa]RID44429.1 hypothetical protein BRARA_I01221 [Brassica rapa]